MASSGGSSEALGAGAAVSTSSINKTKLKRTPVTLNVPRKPEVAHFKVLQWNVLADGLAQNGDFCRVPPGCLEWEYRKPLLIQEILEANADIICLQELNHFDELREVLSGLGYDGAFREKHASPALKYEYPPDGMAVFYRRRRFRCAAEGVQGRSFQDDQTGREQSQGFLQILLYDMLVGRELLVVTTHLKAKDGAECEGMRFQQAGQLLRHVTETVERLEEQQAQAQAGAAANSASSAATAAAAAAGGVASSNGATGSHGAAAGAGGEAHASGDSEPGAGSAAAAAAAETETQAVKGSVLASNGNGNGNGKGAHGGNGAAPSAAGARSSSSSSGCAGGGGGGGGGNGNGSGCAGGGGRKRRGWTVPVLVTGDFNTVPGSITCEAFRSHPLGLVSLWEQWPLDATLSSCSDLDMPMPLVPPAASGAAAPGVALEAVWPEREFSTWKFRVKGESKRISDYIWFSGGGGGGGDGSSNGGGALRPLSRWRMLTEEEIGPGALPCSTYASDHVSLCCEFEWDVDADLEWAPPGREPDWG